MGRIGGKARQDARRMKMEMPPELKKRSVISVYHNKQHRPCGESDSDLKNSPM
jgi:hypothetical protein